MNDLHRIGGVPAVMKALLDAGVLDGDASPSPAARWARSWPRAPVRPATAKIIQGCPTRSTAPAG